MFSHGAGTYGNRCSGKNQIVASDWKQYGVATKHTCSLVGLGSA